MLKSALLKTIDLNYYRTDDELEKLKAGSRSQSKSTDQIDREPLSNNGHNFASYKKLITPGKYGPSVGKNNNSVSKSHDELR